jgi:hypothetical protein
MILLLIVYRRERCSTTVALPDVITSPFTSGKGTNLEGLQVVLPGWDSPTCNQA